MRAFMDDLQRQAGLDLRELRGLLGCFLFSDGDVFKRIGVLSGGERNRLLLARLFARPANVLVSEQGLVKVADFTCATRIRLQAGEPAALDALVRELNETRTVTSDR